MSKSQRIGFFVTDIEKAWIVHLARLEGGLSQAALMRRLIHQAATQHQLTELTTLDTNHIVLSEEKIQ
jgi:hypothetical protein